MKCPHCGIHFHDNWNDKFFERFQNILTSRQEIGEVTWRYRSAICPACHDCTIEVIRTVADVRVAESRMIYPIGANRGPVPAEVPPEIADDYIEACNVLPISAKAYGALSRRCLQNILHAHGYKGRDLSQE
jgi:hypothetical protein